MSDITLEEFQSGEEVRTEDALLRVVVSQSDPLSIGAHIIELVVTDNAGNSSVPARVQLIVQDSQRPTAVLNVADAQGRVLDEPVVEIGTSFILTAKGSMDVSPGTGIASYTWRLRS
jgi:hypothetical protein